MNVRGEITNVASAEAIFGSVSRGDIDAMSDRDILILDDDLSILRERTRVLESEGWSVASYTYAKLQSLARRGALFIQHLKLEAHVLHDQSGRFAQILDRFQPLQSYTAEIRDNDRLSYLAGAASRGSRGALLAADVLYVAVRNYGILSLAERGIHTYSYSAVIEALEAEGMISTGGAKALSGLRYLKCLYRAGEQEHATIACEAINHALAALPKAHFPQKLRVVDPPTILRGPSPQGVPIAYLQLRDLERRLVALETLKPDAVMNEDLAQLWKWVVNPRAYAPISSRLAPRMRLALEAKLARIEAEELVATA